VTPRRASSLPLWHLVTLSHTIPLKCHVLFELDPTNFTRCQFNQRYMWAFFVQKCFSLVTFWQKKIFCTKNAHVKRWWNWLQDSYKIFDTLCNFVTRTDLGMSSLWFLTAKCQDRILIMSSKVNSTISRPSV
jgi:hypothetical protein